MPVTKLDQLYGLELQAASAMGVGSLEPTGRDSADFGEIGKGSMRHLLVQAYLMGRQDGRTDAEASTLDGPHQLGDKVWVTLGLGHSATLLDAIPVDGSYLYVTDKDPYPLAAEDVEAFFEPED